MTTTARWRGAGKLGKAPEAAVAAGVLNGSDAGLTGQEKAHGRGLGRPGPHQRAHPGAWDRLRQVIDKAAGHPVGHLPMAGLLLDLAPAGTARHLAWLPESSVASYRAVSAGRVVLVRALFARQFVELVEQFGQAVPG